MTEHVREKATRSDESAIPFYLWNDRLPAIDADVKPNLIPVLKTRRILRGKVLANFLSNLSNILPPTTESNNTLHTH
jgi:hypothetical protein